MGPYPLQTWHPMLRLPAQLWRRLQGQPLLQMCVWVCVRESPIACSFQSGPVAKQQPCALNRNSFLPFPADDGSESRTPQEETEENNFIEQEEPRNPPKPPALAPHMPLPPRTTRNPLSRCLESTTRIRVCCGRYEKLGGCATTGTQQLLYESLSVV